MQLISIVSLCLEDCQHQISSLIGNDHFWSCHADCMPKWQPGTKVGAFDISWISRRDRVGLSKCLDFHVHYRAGVSASKFHVLICSGLTLCTTYDLENFTRFWPSPTVNASLQTFICMCIQAPCKFRQVHAGLMVKVLVCTHVQERNHAWTNGLVS